jgi:glyoxylase I family protein
VENANPADAILHLTLTVRDTARSKDFYTKIWTNHPMDLGARVILGKGSLLIALTPPPNPEQAIANDRFNENRIGLDHVSFSVASRADLEVAAKLLDENGVSHGTINDLGQYGLAIYVMAFRDPDNIQLELTAPHG